MIGDQRALRIVDKTGATLNERRYRDGIESTDKLIKELETLKSRWQQTLFVNDELEIVNVLCRR